MKSVIFIAPPAAGKGTQSSYLESYGYMHISTGDMLRNEISSGSELGKKIDKIITDGLLVGDDIVIELIKNKLSSIDNEPFILDGFPRTLNQAIELNNILTALNKKDIAVIYLSLDMESALKRSLGRLTCKCGKSYNIYYDDLMPKQEGICDNCKNILVKRNDDNEESFKQRYNTFIKNTEPILDFYKSKELLYNIDARNDSSIVSEKIKDIVI